MGYRKITLRRLPPVTRKYARLLGELDSILHRGKNLVEELARIERESQALAHARERGIVVEMPQTEDEPGFEI
jgi:precorrin-6B methylase 2